MSDPILEAWMADDTNHRPLTPPDFIPWEVPALPDPPDLSSLPPDPIVVVGHAGEGMAEYVARLLDAIPRETLDALILDATAKATERSREAMRAEALSMAEDVFRRQREWGELLLTKTRAQGTTEAEVRLQVVKSRGRRGGLVALQVAALSAAAGSVGDAFATMVAVLQPATEALQRLGVQAVQETPAPVASARDKARARKDRERLWTRGRR